MKKYYQETEEEGSKVKAVNERHVRKAAVSAQTQMKGAGVYTNSQRHSGRVIPGPHGTFPHSTGQA